MLAGSASAPVSDPSSTVARKARMCFQSNEIASQVTNLRIAKMQTSSTPFETFIFQKSRQPNTTAQPCRQNKGSQHVDAHPGASNTSPCNAVASGRHSSVYRLAGQLADIPCKATSQHIGSGAASRPAILILARDDPTVWISHRLSTTSEEAGSTIAIRAANTPPSGFGRGDWDRDNGLCLTHRP